MNAGSPFRRIVLMAVVSIGVLVCWGFWGAGERAEAQPEPDFDSRIDLRVRSAGERIRLKTEIIQDIMEGRTQLDQAVEQFIVLNESGEDLTETIRNLFPAPTLEESTRLHILSFTYASLKAYPEARRDEILARIGLSKEPCSGSTAQPTK
jgi:hypothetical protein